MSLVQPKRECPCCGSTDTSLREVTRTYTPPYGESVETVHGVLDCAACTESVVATGYSDAIQATIRKADIASARNILDKYVEEDKPLVHLERALRIHPFGTLEKWRTGKAEPTSAEITLLRLVHTYPWLINAVDNNFDPEYTTSAVECAFKVLHGLAERQQDLPEDFARVLNENFWDLL